MLFFFKQKTAYEMRISDWSSDVCSSDLTIVMAAIMATVVSVIARAVPVIPITIDHTAVVAAIHHDWRGLVAAVVINRRRRRVVHGCGGDIDRRRESQADAERNGGMRQRRQRRKRDRTSTRLNSRH